MKKKKRSKRESTSQRKRREAREGLFEFFVKHTLIIQNNKYRCKECGARLNGSIDEVAHILPKQRYPKLMKDDNNVVYLCGIYSNNQCHNNFDNWSTERVQKMNIFEFCRQKILAFKTKGVIFDSKLYNKFRLDE